MFKTWVCARIARLFVFVLLELIDNMISENFLDALLFMLDQTPEPGTILHDKEKVLTLLDQLGFSPLQADSAFAWLQGLSLHIKSIEDHTPAQANSYRVFTPEEEIALNEECRGLLHDLERVGAIDGQIREIIIDRVLHLNGRVHMDPLSLKWMTMFILATMPDKKGELAWIETWDTEYSIH